MSVAEGAAIMKCGDGLPLSGVCEAPPHVACGVRGALDGMESGSSTHPPPRCTRQGISQASEVAVENCCGWM